jgi:molecular chaperone GrpE (heat shock protein)
MKILIIILIALIAPLSVKASDYDIYVDESYSEDDSDGSSEKPYKEIGDAIEEAGSGDNIYVKNGTYEEHITLSSGINITGEDKNKVIIKGSSSSPTITVKNNNTLKNITVTGGHTGILFEGKGELDNCIIKNVTGDAISLAEDKGNITVKNSNMNNNTKGLYAQKGTSFNISKNNFEDNKGEGIDIRQNTNGSINGNYIANNKEGGIEIVVGSSDVSIKNNTIKKNKASGIAAQFYKQARKTGEIQISKNTISYNGAYGITCKAPSGGDRSKEYFNKSLELKDNKIEHNKGKSISGSCKIMEAVTEEEEKSNQAIESETANELPEEENVEEKKLEEETIKKEEEQKLLELEKKVSLNNTFSQINASYQELFNQLNQDTLKIKNQNKIRTFFLGSDYEKINAAKEKVKGMEQIKKSLNETLKEFESIQDTEDINKIALVIKELEDKTNAQNSLIDSEEKKFSLFGWAFKLFRK